MSETPDTPPQPQPIRLLALLADLRAGSIVHEVQGELAKAVKAASVTGKTAKVILTLNVQPEPKAPGAVFVQADVASKIPQRARGADLLYSDAEGGLHHSDPRQTDWVNSKPRVVGGVNVDMRTGEVVDPPAASA